MPTDAEVIKERDVLAARVQELERIIDDRDDISGRWKLEFYQPMSMDHSRIRLCSFQNQERAYDACVALTTALSKYTRNGLFVISRDETCDLGVIAT